MGVAMSGWLRAAVVAGVVAASLVAGAAVLIPELQETPSLTGQVVTADGQAVAGAVVRSSSGTTGRTDDAGRFSLSAPAGWVTATASGWLPRTRAAVPGRNVLVRLAPDGPGVVTLAFGGDVMFGRRFYDPRDDGTGGGLLDPKSDVADHEALLAGVAPLLADADLTAVNLESSLTPHPYYDPTLPRPAEFHQTKDYAFSSAPAAAQALADSGVDVVGLANNHLYDRLADGVSQTRRALTDAGLEPGSGSFGAGATVDEAWAPALRTVRGDTVAFVGCTSIPGDDQAVTYVAGAGKGGAARCEPGRLRRAVRAARSHADTVVVMIHGGYEYGRLPSAQVTDLSDTAVAAGATLVVNHHPHVVGGLRFDGGRLTAWTLGNLLFDQDVWPTFESYVLHVAVRGSEVLSAWVEPLQVLDYQPTGVFGAAAQWVAEGTKALSAGPWVVDDGSLWLDAAGAARSAQRTVPDTGLFRITAGCAAGAGRELLWTGDFEAATLRPGQSGLWNITPDDPYRFLTSDAAHHGHEGVLLHRAATQSEDVILTPLHRVLVSPGHRLTLLVDHKALHGSPEATVRLSWYNDTRGGSQARTEVALPTGGDWTTARVDVTVPAHAVAVEPYVVLSPPDDGVSQLGVDDVRLVDWDEPGCDYVQGPGTVVQTALPPAGSRPAVEAVSAVQLPATAPASIPAALLVPDD